MEPSVVLDPQILETAALIMFERLTLARGELVIPCRVEVLDESVQTITDLLRALHQQPPQAELQRWRDLIADQLQEGSQRTDPHRLAFHYQPIDPALGLTGGVNLGFALEPAPPQDPALDPATIDPHQLYRRLSLAWGEILFPCVPALLPQILQIIQDSLGALGQVLSHQEIDQYHRVLEPRLMEWYRREPGTRLVFRYGPLEESAGLLGGFTVELVFQRRTLEDSYHHWTETRSGALFGERHDAKVMAVAMEIATDRDPGQVRILDVGAGTGRNSFPLARAGFQVEAVELTEALSQQMIQNNPSQGLNLRVITGDFLDPTLALSSQGYDLVFLSEVAATHFHTLDQVRQAVRRMCELTRIGGWILFDLFLCLPEYDPSLLVRQVARVNWTHVVTEGELDQILQDMPVEIRSIESSYDFERTHTPPDHWPPTPWYEDWSTGRNLFPIDARPPVELRWLLLRRLPGDLPSA